MCACLHEEKKKQKNKQKTYVSVQTTTNVTRNPLAISYIMVTAKPTVQRLCWGKKMETDSQSERESLGKRAGVVQV